MPRQPRWPVDYESIEKGRSFWSPQETSNLVGEPTRTPEFAMKQVAFIKELMAQLWAIGKFFTVRLYKGHVVVLSDRDAFHYNVDRYFKGWKAMREARERLAKVDTSEFSDVERLRYNEKLGQMNVMLAQMEATRRAVRPEPIVYKRNTPTHPVKPAGV